MPYDPSRHHRRSIRLRGYDYRQAGAYFITICAQERTSTQTGVFGTVEGAAVRLSPPGQMVQATWDELPDHYPGVEVDAFVVMPDHVHGIVVLSGLGALGLPDVVHRLKSLTTARYRHGVRAGAWPQFRGRLWQRDYYERIVRDARALDTIRAYIEQNPARASRHAR